MSTIDLPCKTVTITPIYGFSTTAQVGLKFGHKDQPSTITPYIHFWANDPYAYTGSDGIEWLKKSFPGEILVSASPSPGCETIDLSAFPIATLSDQLAYSAHVAHSPRSPMSVSEYKRSKDSLPSHHRDVLDSILGTVPELYDQLWAKVADMHKSTEDAEESALGELFRYSASQHHQIVPVLSVAIRAFRCERRKLEEGIKSHRLARGLAGGDVRGGASAAHAEAQKTEWNATKAWSDLQGVFSKSFPNTWMMSTTVEGFDQFLKEISESRY